MGRCRPQGDGGAPEADPLPFQELGVDPAGYFGEVVIDVGDIHADDAVAQRLEPHLSSDIVLPLTAIVVGRTVDLDDQPSRRAVEVDEVRSDGVLAAKLPSVELATFQTGPHADLGVAHRLAHPS